MWLPENAFSDRQQAHAPILHIGPFPPRMCKYILVQTGEVLHSLERQLCHSSVDDITSIPWIWEQPVHSTGRRKSLSVTACNNPQCATCSLQHEGE